MSTLYIVATPIGNLGDITYRAVETLRNVDCIAAEDTRNTSVLLSHYSIQKRLVACHSQNEINSANGIVKLLDEGKNVALVTDAGTPSISDPGARTVEECLKTGRHKVVPIPGVSAACALLSVAGNVGKEWTFEGFLPKSQGKMRKKLSALAESGNAFLLYESPFRITKLLDEISRIAPSRRVTLGRELTKIHEEILRGIAADISSELKSRNAVKGEISLVVHSETKDETPDDDID